MATERLLQWVNSIRLTMATDPGRQLFKDQVQSHGFSFLDDYLDSILSNAKQDALIDLVKTPGRKRIMPQKIKPASKYNDGVTLFSKDEGRNHIQNKKSLFGNSDTVQEEELDKAREVEDVQAPSYTVPSVPLASESTGVVVANPLHVSHNEPNELSMIAEDDEAAEKSRLSSPSHMEGIELQDETKAAQPVDIQISIPNDQPLREPTSCNRQDSMKPPSRPSVDQTHIGPPTNERDAVEGKDGDSPSDPNKEFLPSKSCPTTSSEPNTIKTYMQAIVEVPVPVPTEDNTTNVDLLVPLRDVESPPASPNNHNLSTFPSLPAPAPLRKSLRAGADNNSTQVNLGAATPGTAVTGKRTSWLQKARQAKALEIAGKKSTRSLSSASLLQPQALSLAVLAKRKSTDAFSGPSDDDNGRHRKVAKTTDIDVVTVSPSAHIHSAEPVTRNFTSPLPLKSEQREAGPVGTEDMLGFLKKTIEGLGACAPGKSVRRSLSVSATSNALAEAKAAAEARIAERNMNKEEPVAFRCGKPENLDVTVEGLAVAPAGQTLPSKQQPIQSTAHVKQSPPHVKSSVNMMKVFQPQVPLIAGGLGDANGLNHQSVILTPPGTPPVNRSTFIPPPGPVFNKPPPVFKPPSKHLSSVVHDTQDEISKPPIIHRRSSPTVLPLTTQSTMESIRSEVVFDKDGDTHAWMTGTQETSYTTAQMNSQDPNICDEDDSWPIDEKISEGVQWICANAKDDSTTWSSLDSHHNISEEVTQSRSRTELDAEHNEELPNRHDTDIQIHDTNLQNASESDPEDDIHMNNIRLVNPPRSQSQLSHSSSASSQQSQVGFFGQASKLITNMMGSGKKPKLDVKKVLHKASVAAKKQQEETDRKTARLKDMENRRQLALQRKAEEEKAKMEEQERKIKEENERRKREREEQTDKRPLKAVPGRKDEEVSKKRKIEVEKKAEIKIPVNLSKPIVKSALKQPSALSSSAAYNSSFNITTAPTPGTKLEVKPNKSTKGKGKPPTKLPAMEDDIPQPSQIVQTQMAARAKAQLQAAKSANGPPPIPSENIELPDINSEYSDSEDEDRKRTFDPPDWAQSPELREALQQQSSINPDDIFGAIRPLKMEELFKTRSSRFRARTSSANWAGADRLTVEEEREYARRMGFK